MPGNIVPLYLCKTCKGLFVFESQAENHQVKCNGDAFKSPANLFVCEREHYLELITPSSSDSDSVPGPKASKKAQQNRLLCERKRRKTSPQISTTSETTRVTGRSFLSKDDLSTLTQGPYRYGMGGQQMRETNRKTVPRSRSLPQANITLPQCNAGANNLLHTNTCSTMGQCVSHQNILNSVVSLATPVSQSFVFTGNGDQHMPCSSNTFSPAKSNVSFSSGSNLQGADHDKPESSNSESVMIQKNSTPATDLLAYLSQLQHGSSVLQPALLSSGSGKEEEFPSLVHPVPVDKQSKLPVYPMVNDALGEANGKSPSMHEPSTSMNTSNSEQREHVDILTGEILKLEDFPFKTVTAVTNASEIHHTNQLLDQTVYTHDIGDFLPFEPAIMGEGGKSAQITNPLQVPVYHMENKTCDYSELPTTCTDRSMHLKTNGSGKDIIVYKKADNDMVQTFQTECSSSPAVHVFDNLTKPEVHMPETAPNQKSSLPGSVVLFLEPNGQIIQTMAVDGAVNSDTEINTTLPVTAGINAEDLQLCAGNALQVQVCESIPPNGIGNGESSSHQMTLAEPALQPDSMNSSGRETACYVTSGKVVMRAKTKTQIRQEELSALREEVLQQAREIPVEGEAKKIHYVCNVCGHVAKSVKFMHNHLQMHADGKVHFECDQCEFKSRLRSKLVEHQQRHTRSRLLCHLCPATFMDIASLNRHVTAKHTDNEDLKCDRCDFKASYASLLKEHMLKHTGELLCCEAEGCSYKTPYLRALRVHQKRHSSEKNYRCHQCSYDAVEKSTLDRHLKSHTQERPYQCSHCDFRANTKYSVVVHMQHKHQFQKSCYACDQCSFYTSYASSIAKHLKTHLSTFTCPLCNTTTHTLDSIKKHLHQVHQVVNMEVVQNDAKINTKDYLCTQPDPPPPAPLVEPDKPLLESEKLMEPDRAMMDSDKALMESSKVLMDSLMADTMNIDSQDLPPFPLTDMSERSHIDPMKLTFHFQDPNLGPSGSGTNLPRASSIPDLSTFAGMNRSNSQSDMLNFTGISTVTRSNSMSDLLSFANSMCMDGGENGEADNMDISLSDTTTTSMDVRGLSLEEGGESSLSEDGKVDSPGGVLLTLQCSKCLMLLVNEEDVDNHKKICRGPILVV